MTNEEKILEALAKMQTQMDIRFDQVDARFDQSDARFDRLESDVSELKTDVSLLKTDVSELKTDVSTLKTDVSELKTDVSTLKTDVADLKTDVTSINLTLEQVIERKLDLLAEGHQTLLETLAPKNRVEQLEEDVSFLKSVIKVLAEKVDSLSA